MVIVVKDSFKVSRTIEINAPGKKAWDALTKSVWTKRYMYGYEVESDWNAGSSVLWKTNAGGKTYTRKGKVLSAKKSKLLKFTDYNPEAVSDEDESKHAVVTYEISENKSSTVLYLNDDCAGDEKKFNESSKFWDVVLPKLKEILET